MLWAAQDILVPTAASIVVAMALTPVVSALERLGLPSFAASSVVVLAAAALIAGSAALIAPGLQEWLTRAPEIAETLEEKARPIKEWLSNVQTATEKLEEVTQMPGNGSAAPAAPVQQESGGLLATAPVVLAQTLYVLVLALFLISVRATYRKRLILLPKERENRLRVARIMNETLTQVSHYLFTMTIINAGVGVVTALLFAVLGVPYPVVWGFVFGAASFIPYVGPTLTIILCAVVQVVTMPTLEQAIAPTLALLVVNTVESNFVTPWLLSRRLAVSSIAVFLTVALFAWLWGPFAAIVAVPLLIVFSAVARHVPGLEPWAVMLRAESEPTVEAKDPAREKFFALEDEEGKPVWRRWWRDRARPKPGDATAEAQPGEPSPSRGNSTLAARVFLSV